MSRPPTAAPGMLHLGPIAAGIFFITTAVFVRAPLLPEMGRDLDMSPRALGAFIAVFALGRIVADVPAGRLTDHRPVGSMMAIAGLIVAVASFAGGLAPTSAVAYLASFILGIGSAWTNTTGIAAFADAPRERRGLAMSGFGAALMVGQAIGPTFGGAAASIWNWRAAYFAAALLSLGIGVVLARWVQRDRTIESSHSVGAAHPVRPAVLVAIYLLPAVQFGVAAALIQTLVPIVADGELALSVGTIGLAIGLGGLLRLVGAVSSGYISDRYSRRWALFPGLVLQLAGLLVFVAAESSGNWWAAIILFSMGSSSVNVGATILADLSEGGPLGRRLGVFRVTGDVALLVAPFAAGALYEVYGRASATTPLVVFVIAVIALAFFVIPETLQREA